MGDDDDNDGEEEGRGRNSPRHFKARFYRALYQKLMSSEIHDASSQHSLFLNLVYKALREDGDCGRIYACCKRLMQLGTHGTPSLAAAALMVVSELCKARPSLSTLLLREKADDRQVVLRPRKEEGAEREGEERAGGER